MAEGSHGLERKRRTALMIAAMHGNVEVMQYLILAGADLNMHTGIVILNCSNFVNENMT